VFTEWTIPTSSSGSNDVTVSSGLVYFTEYSGNKIGRLDPYTGMFTEWSVPTASSAPSSIYVFGSSVYFTESAGNKIGLLTVNPVATITVTSVSNTMSTVTTTGGVSAVSNELLSPSTVASLVNFCWWDSIATTTSSATVLQDTVTVVPLQSGLSYVFVGAPQKQSVGPAGTVAANWIDGTAAAIMMGMIEHPTFSFDTNATAIDQDTNVATGGGSLLSAIPGGSTIFLSGGPFVNALVRNFEFNHATENTPVYFGSVVERGITYYVLFNSSTGKEISNTGAEVSPLMTIGPNNQTSPRTDFFVIEAFTDSHSNQVVMAYGYSGYGTFASALYFKTMFFPRQGNTLGNGYEIARWQDTNGNGLPDSADSYTILHSSYVGPS
jgi:hypothetical protein